MRWEQDQMSPQKGLVPNAGDVVRGTLAWGTWVTVDTGETEQ